MSVTAEVEQSVSVDDGIFTSVFYDSLKSRVVAEVLVRLNKVLAIKRNDSNVSFQELNGYKIVVNSVNNVWAKTEDVSTETYISCWNNFFRTLNIEEQFKVAIAAKSFFNSYWNDLVCSAKTYAGIDLNLVAFDFSLM